MGLNWLPSLTILLFTLELCRSQCEECEINGPYVGCRAMELTSVPECLPENVIWLDLWNNKIAELTQFSFQSITAIEILDMSYNIIRRVDEASFINLKNLTTLVLSGNYIADLHDNLFSNNGKLISLNIAYNLLTSLNELTFQPLVEMESLVLYANEIQKIPHSETFSKNWKLSLLDIGWNLLTTLDRLLFSSNRNMEIYLKDNPWHCDCTLYEVIQDFKVYNISIRGDAYCASPPELAGVSWNDLSPPASCDSRRLR